MNYVAFSTPQLITLGIILFPLVGAIIAGLSGKWMRTALAQFITCLGVGLSLLGTLYLAYQIFFLDLKAFNFNLYNWITTGKFNFAVGFLIDPLTVVMLLIVTFVSLLVHIYSIGYMRGDPGNKRFFSYMSLFTFSMLVLVAANNFLELYFGWEAVGLVSYLLIGFWYERESAVVGSLKAFLVNRVGDFGFILGISLLFVYFGSLNYNTVFQLAPQLSGATISLFPNTTWSVITVICILLFVGAMGKSAQMPLHVWLPESMEGPTPISALIHAATMVTAGVYLIARMSPLFEYSATALNLILVLGATTALFMGFIAIVQTDIKRVIAYSTLSQLGYMMVGLGASAYAAGIFHLITHAFFKALLFLAAGSVIVAMHHEQNMQKMGGLAKYLPITYIAFLVGALALAALPPFSGFYSKDAIIDAVQLSTLPAAHYGYYCLLIGAFVTAFYIFRAFFLVFHTEERYIVDLEHPIKESPLSITIPLILLTLCAIVSGFLLVSLFLNPSKGILSSSLFILKQHSSQGMPDNTSSLGLLARAAESLPSWFALAGLFFAFLFYIKFPRIPAILKKRFSLIYQVLWNKYGFDDFNYFFFVRGGKQLAKGLFIVDDKVVDKKLVNGSGRLVSYFAFFLKKIAIGVFISLCLNYVNWGNRVSHLVGIFLITDLC